MTHTCTLSVVVFAYNEAETVEPVLRELLAWLGDHEPDAQVVFVDDGSTDGCGALARAVLEHDSPHPSAQHVTVRHSTNRGIGAALKTGVRHAHGSWVTFLPADGQVPPQALQRLRQRASEASCELVLSTYEQRDDGRHRKVLSWGMRGLIGLVHQVRIRSEGPYLFRRSLFQEEQLLSDSFFLNFEFPIRAVRAGISTAQVRIPCRQRLGGVAKSAAAKPILHVTSDLLLMRMRGLPRR